MSSQVFRVRVLLELNCGTRLHSHHAAVIHALVSAAWGAANHCPAAMPDGLLIEAPEQCRLEVVSGQRYAFGFTLIDADGATAARRVASLLEGLRAVGREKADHRIVFGGNFSVAAAEDLVAGQIIRPGRALAAVAQRHMEDEAARLAACDSLTLRFLSPLLAERPKSVLSQQPSKQGSFMDRTWFSPAVLIRRLGDRLVELGMFDQPLDDAAVGRLRQVSNQLVWLSFSYGPNDRRKPKHGAVGRVRISAINRAVAELLVWGQYVHVGGALGFGFGRYRIGELGPEPFACRRAVELTELAFADTRLDLLSNELDLPSGQLRAAARSIRDARYEADPHFRIVISSPSGRDRRLAIPSRRDRALQRCVHDQLAPALDRFFEDSSLAYRAGLGVHRAAARLKQAVQAGYSWALKADFRAFFDSIPHEELAARLEAFLGDDALADLIMRWIRAGSPAADRGIPTGAAISPLVANLFLDTFDEQVRDAGGFLVRYADDFLILYRSREEAESSHATAAAIAASICLELNADKTRLLDLREPFEFLGFVFTSGERWEFSSLMEPVRVRELGWQKKVRDRSPAAPPRLPGESELAESGDSIVICGPNVRRLDSQGRRLLVEFSDGSPTASLPLEQLRELVLIDAPDISRSALIAMNAHNISWTMIDAYGNPQGTFVVHDPMDAHASLLAQAEAAVDGRICLAVARELVMAKLRNHAALARAVPGRFNDLRTASRLEELARQAGSAADVQTLLGIEGTGAALWYGNLGGRLARGFFFEKRIAPGAADPVNALLNLGQTVLHDLTAHLIQLVGFAPATGLFHTPRAGHAALASDMQETFRHLVDRTVLHTLGSLHPERDFTPDPGGPWPLRISPRAVKLFVANLHRTLALNCQGRGQSLPKPYRMQIASQIRSLRQHLVTRGEKPFRPFVHPGP